MVILEWWVVVGGTFLVFVNVFSTDAQEGPLEVRGYYVICARKVLFNMWLSILLAHVMEDLILFINSI